MKFIEFNDKPLAYYQIKKIINELGMLMVAEDVKVGPKIFAD